jgi:hypothetical protein
VSSGVRAIRARKREKPSVVSEVIATQLRRAA